MRRKLLLIVLVLCLLAAGVAFFPAGTSTPASESITRMAELGLVLLDSDEGVSVLAVKDKSPADHAGIQPGDILLQADGHIFATTLQLEEMLQTTQQLMQLQLMRDKEELITVTLGVR